MTDIRPLATWLRSLAGLLALAGALALSGCGGGAGAPNNAFKPFVLLNTAGGTAFDLYSGVPATMEVSGGLAPYRVVSSNPTVLPVAEKAEGSPITLIATTVGTETVVQITVQDSMGRVAAAQVVVHAAPLLNSLTITPNAEECGLNAICSGQTGTATVTLLGPGGGVVPGRQVRFDVGAGPFGITTTIPGQPIVATLTVTSDASGVASVIVKANVSAPTQFAQLRVTDLGTGQQLVGNFLIQQLTDGSTILTVVPNEAKITAAYKGVCSSGFLTRYFIYGGTPPYRVTSTFPDSITLINSIVAANGGYFDAVTNGYCFDPMTFSILDATGRQTTATLSNVPGTEDAPTVETPPLANSPASYTDTACTGKTFPFVVSGGRPPYNVTASQGAVDPQTVATAGGTARVSGLLTGSGVTSVVILDSSLPQKSATATITCNNPTSPALSAAPASYTSAACTGASFPIAIFGGIPPYNVTSTRGVPTPPVVAGSGGSTTITGLVTGTGVTAVVILDQSVPQKSVGVNITCEPAGAAPPPPALNVTNGFTYTLPQSCSTQVSNFAITGGTPPYSVAFAAPVPPTGTISPSSGLQSGQGFSVTNLPAQVVNSPVIWYVTVSDSGAFGVSQQQAVRSIACN